MKKIEVVIIINTYIGILVFFIEFLFIFIEGNFNYILHQEISYNA